jgi:hypothetical protein
VARPARGRPVAALIAFCTLLSSAWFSNDMTGANPVSRLALTLALVDEHRLTIDTYAGLTVDKALFEGHHYSDKAPGMALLAVPLVALAEAALFPPHPVWATDAGFTDDYKLLGYFCTVAISGLAVAAAAFGFVRAAQALGADAGAAVFGATAYVLGTPTLGWAGTFFGHATSGAFLFGGFALLLAGRRLLGGLCLGLATLVELPAAVAAAIIVIGLCADRPRAAWPVLLGGLVGVAPLFAYNTLAFGAPLHLGYASVEGFADMQSGFFGIGPPSPSVAAELLVGRYRGLLPLAPVLAALPLGLLLCWRRRDWRRPGLVCAFVAAWYLLMNSGYAYWDGGASFGPRHLVPALPFAAFPLVPLWQRAGVPGRLALALLLAAGATLTLAAAGIGQTETMPRDADEIADYLWPAARRGDFVNVVKHFFGYRSAWNLAPPVVLWLATLALAALPLSRGGRYRPG